MKYNKKYTNPKTISSAKILLFVLSLLYFSCQIRPNIQEKGAADLQGKWEQINDSASKKSITSTTHHFTFACDSFYVHMRTISKANYYSEECFNKGIWDEYAKGRYVILGDTLFVFGTFTKANFKQKISGCYRIGEYIEKFIILQHPQDSLQLRSLTTEQKIHLHLQEKTHCIPKTL